MSFTDLMSSGRGPGVIGMALALIVLLGFGTLFTFVFDEGMQGGGQTIESVIREQGKEISSLKTSVASKSKALEAGPARIAAAKELSDLTRENRFREGTIDGSKKNVEAVNAQITTQLAAFEEYKDQYRAFARAKAKDEEIPELKARDGTIYHNVIVREVTAIGMQIVHRDGQKRIPFEDLPDEIQDRFQFDPKQKELAKAEEDKTRAEHDAAVAVAGEMADKKMAEEREKRLAEEKAKRQLEIASKEARIVSLDSEIQSLEAEIRNAEAQAAAARASGRMFINRSGSLRSQIRSKQNEQANLRQEIASLKAKL